MGLLMGVRETGAAGDWLTVKLPAFDQAVTAAVVGEESPWCERTRQNLVPGVSDNSVRFALLSCGALSSMLEKLESFAISNS